MPDTDETPDEPPEWQGARLGTYGPDRPYPPDQEAFDVERAPAPATCGYYPSEEARFDASVRRCRADAVYRFYVRDPETFAWGTTDRCAEHATGPDVEALALPEATTILWIDAAEAYPVCGTCYERHRDDQWTGSTPNPEQDKLAAVLRERIDNGARCAFCRRDA